MQLDAPATIASLPLGEVGRTRPRAGPGQLLIEVAACAVCRTDLQLVEGELRPRRLPIVPGHQVVGRVADVGEDVSGWQVGDRVAVIWLASACGACGYRRSERENLCREARFTGWDVDGGFATHVIVAADFAVRLPPTLGDVAEAPLLCGPSASLTIQVARHRGARIHVATRNPAEQQRALALGAESVGGYAGPPPEPLDAAITFAPIGTVVIDALRAVAPGGTVVINAIHLDRIPAFDYALLWEERGLRSVANVTRQDAREFLALAAELPIVIEARQYRLADTNLALADLAAGRLDAPAAVLVPR